MTVAVSPAKSNDPGREAGQGGCPEPSPTGGGVQVVAVPAVQAPEGMARHSRAAARSRAQLVGRQLPAVVAPVQAVVTGLQPGDGVLGHAAVPHQPFAEGFQVGEGIGWWLPRRALAEPLPERLDR